MAYYGANKKYEMVIPIILVLLVVIVVAAKMDIFCPAVFQDIGLCGGRSAQILVISEDADGRAGQEFADDIENVLREPIADSIPFPCHLEGGYLTTNNFKLVVLYGDGTSLPSFARDEIAAYVSNGGSLMIVRGAGLKQYDSTCSQTSEMSFSWRIDDMADIIHFKPDCGDLTQCNDVSHVTVTKDQINDLYLIPTEWEHPIIKRSGINIKTPVDVNEYSAFDKVILSQAIEPRITVAKWGWEDAEGKYHSAPAIVGYDVGMAGTGGRVVYLSYDPIQFGVDHHTVFANILDWAMKEA